MRVLALDTTLRAGSVALVEDDRLVDERPGDPTRSHAERLPGELLVVLEGAGLTVADVDLFAVAAGPGSFTGLRIGIATIQGLALAAGRPVVVVSTLELMALAAAAGRPIGAIVGAWMDARRNDVFAALYRVGEPPALSSGHLIELDPPRVDRPAAILSAWGHPLDVLTGDGAVLYAPDVGSAVAIVEGPVLAGLLGRCAIARAREGQTVHPAAVQPVYVRRPDAEIARDQIALGARGREEPRA